MFINARKLQFCIELLITWIHNILNSIATIPPSQIFSCGLLIFFIISKHRTFYNNLTFTNLLPDREAIVKRNRALVKDCGFGVSPVNYPDILTTAKKENK